MSSPARAVHNNSEAIKRVQHLTDAAVLLWPDAPHLAQYYLFRMQQAAEKDNLKIPHRTASKICASCGGLVTSKVRLLSAKRRSRRSAQLAARETKSQLNMVLGHATDTEPSPHLRNVLQQHCARCDHKRLLIAFQHDPVRTVTPVKRSAAPSTQHTTESMNKSHNNTAPSLKHSAINSNSSQLNKSHIHSNASVNKSHVHSNASVNKSHVHSNASIDKSHIHSNASVNNTPHHTAVTGHDNTHIKNTSSHHHTAGPNTNNTNTNNTNTNTSHPNKHKHSMKHQVAKMLHETKNSSKKKNVQDNLKQFLNSINM